VRSRAWSRTCPRFTYAQPSDPAYWQAQQAFSADHPWFKAHRVNAVSHFPMLEVPDEMAEAIEGFVSTA
jgi:hypothetical protein